MNRSKAVIIVENRPALRVAASAARISTQQGTALEIFEAAQGDERDLKLIGKVLSSGHKSVIEHQTFSIAFEDVSVLVEQFVIECRLASYTVKSRRYVNFGEAGWVTPEGLTAPQQALFDDRMAARFDDYNRLLELGVPKEDARFVLPYGLRSNFYMTLNARELMALICAMVKGRGKGYPEIEALGGQLKAQLDALYPGVMDRELEKAPDCAVPPLAGAPACPRPCEGGAAIVDGPKDALAALNAALAFSGRFAEIAPKDRLKALVLDARPRELEAIHYTMRIENISLSCLTHFTRHRMLSLLIPPVYAALAGGRYVLPETVKAVPEARAIYEAAFADQARAAQEALEMGMRRQDAAYLALSGHQVDVLMGMNARELMHFMKLRSCTRAQWEIRGVAMKLLDALKDTCPALFGLYGPSCRFGPCPEGRMSCGRPWERI